MSREIIMHSDVIGELIVGNLRNRKQAIADLEAYPRLNKISSEIVFQFVEHNKLFGLGISWIDAGLLASAVASNVKIWTDDMQVREIAHKMNLAWIAD